MPILKRKVPCTSISPEGKTETVYRKPGNEVSWWVEFQQNHKPTHALLVKDEVRWLGDQPTLEALYKLLGTRRVRELLSLKEKP